MVVDREIRQLQHSIARREYKLGRTKALLSKFPELVNHPQRCLNMEMLTATEIAEVSGAGPAGAMAGGITGSVAGRLYGSSVGMVAGAAIGSAFGPGGTIAGGFVGRTLGSNFGELLGGAAGAYLGDKLQDYSSSSGGLKFFTSLKLTWNSD